MPDVVQFSFDPLCPWCYQTSRWALRLQDLGILELQWGVFSLELNHFDKPHEEFDASRARSVPALRTAVAVRAEEGQAACGRFYAALGEQYFFKLQDLSEPSVIRGALEEAGVDPGRYDKAVAEPGTWDTVRTEHERLVEETKAFGVPTIRLDAGKGPVMFGPVVSEPPTDEEAVELWQHTLWLTRNTNFHELKRERTSYPDLPHIQKMREERAKAKG